MDLDVYHRRELEQIVEIVVRRHPELDSHRIFTNLSWFFCMAYPKGIPTYSFPVIYGLGRIFYSHQEAADFIARRCTTTTSSN